MFVMLTRSHAVCDHTCHGSDPALKGTLNVMQSAKDANVKRVVGMHCEALLFTLP